MFHQKCSTKFFVKIFYGCKIISSKTCSNPKFSNKMFCWIFFMVVKIFPRKQVCTKKFWGNCLYMNECSNIVFIVNHTTIAGKSCVASFLHSKRRGIAKIDPQRLVVTHLKRKEHILESNPNNVAYMLGAGRFSASSSWLSCEGVLNAAMPKSLLLAYLMEIVGLINKDMRRWVLGERNSTSGLSFIYTRWLHVFPRSFINSSKPLLENFYGWKSLPQKHVSYQKCSRNFFAEKYLWLLNHFLDNRFLP